MNRKQAIHLDGGGVPGRMTEQTARRLAARLTERQRTEIFFLAQVIRETSAGAVPAGSHTG